jgi:HPr kinase/phosphorylase
MASAGRRIGVPRNAGVLILGGSGTGKSDLALRLIHEGASLVADDRVELFVLRGELYGRPPKSLAGLLEIRGVGILEIPYRERARIALAVELVQELSRLPEHGSYAPANVVLSQRSRPPLVRICPQEVSATAKITALLSAFAHRRFRESVKPE